MQQDSCSMIPKPYEAAHNCYRMKTMDYFSHLLVTVTYYPLFSQVIAWSLCSRGMICTYFIFCFRGDIVKRKNIVKIIYTLYLQVSFMHVMVEEHNSITQTAGFPRSTGGTVKMETYQTEGTTYVKEE